MVPRMCGCVGYVVCEVKIQYLFNGLTYNMTTIIVSSSSYLPNLSPLKVDLKVGHLREDHY